MQIHVKNEKKEDLFFQDLELLIDPLVGSKYINVPKFEGENFQPH
jgi:hypothetical protein